MDATTKKLFVYASHHNGGSHADPQVCLFYADPAGYRAGCWRASDVPEIAADALEKGYEVVLGKMPNGIERPLDQPVRDEITAAMSAYQFQASAKL